jgi:hypothetical protein
MTSYNTKAYTIGDVTVTVSKAKEGDAGARLEAFLKWLSNQIVDPGYGVGEGRPDNSLPGTPGQPDNTLPGSGAGTKPVDPDEGNASQLPSFIGEKAKEIAAAILKGTLCDPAQPKR